MPAGIGSYADPTPFDRAAACTARQTRQGSQPQVPAVQVRPGMQLTVPVQQGWPDRPQVVGAAHVIVEELQMPGGRQAVPVVQQDWSIIPHNGVLPSGRTLQTPDEPQESPALHALPAQQDCPSIPHAVPLSGGVLQVPDIPQASPVLHVVPAQHGWLIAPHADVPPSVPASGPA